MPAVLKQSHVLKEPEEIFRYPNGAAVFAGKIPVFSDYRKNPVVVFVPGLGKSAPYFWRKNTMYENAYSSGFRTAFVSFRFPGQKPDDMWKNGEILARQLDDICAYYRVPRVVIIAHSKGGVDSQTAAVHFGAAARIEYIITLSSPHFGSQLADIAYSSSGWPFAELIKAHSPGCFSMQTGFMKSFRDVTDKSAQNVTPIKTFAGNGGSESLTRMRATSLMLDRYGENDGIVTVKSAHNPKGQHLGTYHFNHAQMCGGRYIFPYLEPVLEGREQEPAVAASAVPLSAAPAHIIKGGQLEKGVSEDFFVDSTVENLTAMIMLAGGKAQGHFMLISPGGRKTPLAAKKDVTGVTIMQAAVITPQTGKWRLFATGGKGAYCALLSLSGKDTFCVCPKGGNFCDVNTELRILKTHPDGYDVVGEYSFKNGAKPPELPELPKLSDGFYNIEMNLSGELADGSRYERSLIRPVAEINNIQDIFTGR